MNVIPVRRVCLRVLAFLTAALFLTFFWSCLQLYRSQFESVFLSWLSGPNAKFENETTRIVSLYQPKRLGIASSITILSLPARLDRRQDMDTLRLSLGLPESDWEYTDAIASTDKRVLPVLEWVQYVRSTIVDGKPLGTPEYRFSWPDEEELDSDAPLDLWDTKPWISPFAFGMDSSSGSLSGPNLNTDPPFVPCMTKNITFPFPKDPERSAAIPAHKILTPARVACWYSHLEAIQRVANSPDQRAEETALILEDDVDMESDISEQLKLLWKYLPQHWDIVFLGHCWSNESYHPPLPLNHPHPLHNIHPSQVPQCTHAYALSRQGARRILSHLRYPPFAFSRAIDQAFAWLVESRRIKAFSIVPSLVVQRKVRESDISGIKGSSWREKLRNGILESILGRD